VPIEPGTSTGCPVRDEGGWEIAVPRREGARRSLPVDAQHALSPVDTVAFELGQVVRHVVQHRELGVGAGSRKGAAGRLGEELAVAATEVGCRRHRREIRAARP
jgi:hypothetical protein